jgi:hypothetical protein
MDELLRKEALLLCDEIGTNYERKDIPALKISQICLSFNAGIELSTERLRLRHNQPT